MTTVDWTSPGAFEVAAGVYRIPLPLPNDGLRTVNVYALVGGDGAVLIDSGWAVEEGRDALVAGLGRLDLGLADITRFLITHIHRDHYTLGVLLRREFGMHISLGAGERETMLIAMQPGSNEMQPQIQHMRALGADAVAAGLEKLTQFPDEDLYEAPDTWLQGDEVIEADARRLEVVPTPGHTHGHVVFHDAGNALLFAGDHVLPTITPSIGFEPVLSPSPLGDYLGSLARVRSLPDAMLLPAHGPVVASAHARIDELVAHHDVRLALMEAAVRAGADTAWDVAGQVTWTRRERALGELDLLNQMLAVAETHAHLRLLAAQGRVRETTVAGVVHYAC